MHSICLLSCALTLRTKYQFLSWGRNHNIQGRNKIPTRLSWTHGPICVPRLQIWNLKLSNQFATSLPSQVWQWQEYLFPELLSNRTNLHIRVGPIITTLIGSGGNTQDCILVVRPFKKAFPKQHMLPALGPAEEGEAKNGPCGRICFARAILCFLLWPIAFFLPTWVFSLKVSLHGPPKTSSLFMEKRMEMRNGIGKVFTGGHKLSWLESEEDKKKWIVNPQWLNRR